MRIIDLIHSNEKTAFSFEILPPLKGTGIEKLYDTIAFGSEDGLMFCFIPT